jgi:uncharacterized protein YidB (DUF937 family)
MDYTAIFAKFATEILGPVFLLILTWAGTSLARYIQSKVKNEYLKNALTRLDDAVVNAVKFVQQTVVDALKEANKDGVITNVEKDQIKQKAVEAVKSYLGKKGLLEIAKILGLDDGGLANLISQRIEAAVHDLKASNSNP